MRDALLVRRLEGVANLHGVLQCLRERQGSSERRALDVLHHQVVRADVVQGADVGMVQRGHGVGFALEAFRKLLVGYLEGDDAVQPRVASFIDLTHAAGAEGREDFVGAQFGACC